MKPNSFLTAGVSPFSLTGVFQISLTQCTGSHLMILWYHSLPPACPLLTSQISMSFKDLLQSSQDDCTSVLTGAFAMQSIKHFGGFPEERCTRDISHSNRHTFSDTVLCDPFLLFFLHHPYTTFLPSLHNHFQYWKVVLPGREGVSLQKKICLNFHQQQRRGEKCPN